MARMNSWIRLIVSLIAFSCASSVFAGEADINLPSLHDVRFSTFGGLSGYTILYFGLAVCVLGALFGLVQYAQTKKLPVHSTMSEVSNIIWETCKTYLQQQGKFLLVLWVLIAVCILYYFLGLQHKSIGAVAVILACSILGILGSYGVAWFGIRINTVANSRTAFASLYGNPLKTLFIPLQSGMSVGLLLVCVELFFMICILAFLPRELVGPCFIGFAIGESLGASALRICGGIFTKIADIGADLMKIIFKLPEDDPKNPGVIADCTGDNAGDSVGPTADGFETYGVTGVALIAFLALALFSPFVADLDSPDAAKKAAAVQHAAVCGQLIIWIFAMRILMVLTSVASYEANKIASSALFAKDKGFNWEHPLTNLVWLTSIVSIIVTFIASKMLLGDFTVPMMVDGVSKGVAALWQAH
jgi:K(+)-stimulated pyrophosphate-energized sodium pump